MTDDAPPGADKATYQDGFNELQQHITIVEQESKTTFIKEHPSFMLDPTVVAQRIPPLNRKSTRSCPRVVDLASLPTVCTAADDRSTNGDDSSRKTNVTVLPDGFIHSLSPIIQVRHPALAVPSFYRALKDIDDPDADLWSDEFVWGISPAWPRMLFDWFCDHKYPERKMNPRSCQSWPLVVDGDDVINDNERIISSICSLANLDVAGITKEWQPAEEEVKSRQLSVVQRFLSTLQASSGIVRTGYKQGEVSIEREAKKWVNDFGPDVATRMKDIVEGNMADYEHLMQYKLDPISAFIMGTRTPSLTAGESRVLIIITGGTICMERSFDGFVPARGFLEKGLAPRPSFNDGSEPQETDVVLADGLPKPHRSLRTPVSTYDKHVRYATLEF
ncbi:MAG: hypothetical protein Q9183_000377 [Haloplaca sp. 2 TL-2023]